MAARSLHLVDCIVDGNVSGRDVRIDAGTVFGTTAAQTLNASNSILLGKVTTRRRQEGCVRFSYLPFDSESPRRYRCQPEDATGALRVARDSIGELWRAGVRAARPRMCAGGPDGRRRRRRDGRVALRSGAAQAAQPAPGADEYLRFGLEAGTFIVPQQPKRAAVAVRQAPPQATCPEGRDRAATKTGPGRRERNRRRINRGEKHEG